MRLTLALPLAGVAILVGIMLVVTLTRNRDAESDPDVAPPKSAPASLPLIDMQACIDQWSAQARQLTQGALYFSRDSELLDSVVFTAAFERTPLSAWICFGTREMDGREGWRSVSILCVTDKLVTLYSVEGAAFSEVRRAELRSPPRDYRDLTSGAMGLAHAQSRGLVTYLFQLFWLAPPGARPWTGAADSQFTRCGDDHSAPAIQAAWQDSSGVTYVLRASADDCKPQFCRIALGTGSVARITFSMVRGDVHSIPSCESLLTVREAIALLEGVRGSLDGDEQEVRDIMGDLD